MRHQVLVIIEFEVHSFIHSKFDWGPKIEKGLREPDHIHRG